METALPLIILLVLGVPTALAIWLTVRAVSARNRLDDLARRMDDLQSQVARLRIQPPSAAPVSTASPSENLFKKISPEPPVELKISGPIPAVPPPPIVAPPRPCE